MDKTLYMEEMRRCLMEQRRRHPLMQEEDVVKFAFQAMLGVGHLVASEGAALDCLRREMASLAPDETEPLEEQLSPRWVRFNLRAALAKGFPETEIAEALVRSARAPVPFTREDVQRFCLALDPSDEMKKAAAKLPGENWLPSHSEAYRNAYRPAYRVLLTGCISAFTDSAAP